jgi:hypothetical protein
MVAMSPTILPGGVTKDPSRSEVVDAVLRSKGLNTIDDLDAEFKEPQLSLQQHHELCVIIEMCQAHRPSKLGSLKGSHAKYVAEFERLSAAFQDLQGDGTVTMLEWGPGMGGSVESGPSAGASVMVRPLRPQSAGASRASSRPQSAMSCASRRLASLGFPAQPERSAPRIGAFEVSFKLINTTSHQIYGPVMVFSKISTGHWPGPTERIIKKLQESLQPFLKSDEGNSKMYTHVQAQVEKERGEETPKLAASHGGPPSSPLQQATPGGALPFQATADVLRSKGLNTIDDLEGPEPTTGAPAQAAATTRSSGDGAQTAQYDLDGARETEAEAEAAEAALAGG